MALKFTGTDNLYLDTVSGIYQVRRMVNGRPRQKSTGKTTFAAAKALVPSLLVQLDKEGNDKEVKVPTLREWWKLYRENKHKAPKTWRGQENLMQEVLDEFGHLRLNAVLKHDIQGYLARRRLKGDSPSTLNLRRVVIGAVFQAAIESRLITENPTEGIKGSFATRERVLSLVEQAKLEQYLNPRARLWLRFALGTGLRLSEIAGIRPEDVDFDKRTVTVIGKGAKRRTVPLLKDELVDILRTNPQFAKCGHIDALHRAARAAGIPPVSPHTMRHTFATRYLQGGGDIYVVSLILGHANVGITQRVYAHLCPEDLAARSAGVKLDLGAPLPIPGASNPKEGKVLSFKKA